MVNAKGKKRSKKKLITCFVTAVGLVGLLAGAKVLPLVIGLLFVAFFYVGWATGWSAVFSFPK